MSSHLDSTLLESLGGHLDNFFTCLQGDTNSLTSFLGTLTAIDVTVRAHRDKLHADTLAAIHNFTIVVNSVASNILELEKSGDKIGMELMADVSKILSSKMDDLSIGDKEQYAYVDGRHPLYVKPAYEWLLSHLHNPYPSREFKKKLSQQTNCSIKDIDAWFMDARKRIGWNRLRKIQFSNKQDMIVAAATLFFNPPPHHFTSQPQDPGLLDSSEDYDADFALMKQRATELYSNAFLDGSHCEQLDRRSRPLQQYENTTRRFFYPTPEPPSPSLSDAHLPLAPVSQESCQQRSHEGHSSISPPNEPIALDCPPHRKLSQSSSSCAIAVASLPSPTPTIDLTEEVDNEATSSYDHNATNFYTAPQHSVPTDTTCAQKRKRDSSDEESQPPRHRMRKTPSVQEDLATEPIVTTVVMPPTSTLPQNVRPIKRKRRLSDSGNDVPRKRPHNALCVPRLQAVSDPLPIPRVNEEFSDFPPDFPCNQYHLSDTIPLPVGPHVFDPQEAVKVHHYEYQYLSYQPDTILPALQSDAPSNLSGLSFETDDYNDQEVNFNFSGDLRDHDESQFPDSFFDLRPSINPGTDFDFLSTPQHTYTTSSFDHSLLLEAPSYRSIEPAFLNNLDFPPDYAEQEAKRAHVKRLREEIRMLEEELNGKGPAN